MTAVAIEGIQMPALRSRPHRITVDLDATLYDWARAQRLKDRISTADRVRALLSLAANDPALQRRVEEEATRLEESRSVET